MKAIVQVVSVTFNLIQRWKKITKLVNMILKIHSNVKDSLQDRTIGTSNYWKFRDRVIDTEGRSRAEERS